MQSKIKILKNIKATFFIGIGGIGMSALARYFNNIGIPTYGYDRTESEITKSLISEGIKIHYDDNVNSINKEIKNLPKNQILVVYTPAVPNSHTEFQWFENNKYTIYKRSEILGLITNKYKTTAVAGTHGKTSVSTIITHIFKYAEINFNAFLGGISKNYETNLILSSKPEQAEFAITEADEFDRSFLQLYPWCGIITSIDEDHLDIYEDLEDLKRTFEKFASQINKCGYLIIKKNIEIEKSNFPFHTFSYSFNEKADYYAKNIKTNANYSKFDIVTPKETIENIIINIPGNLNIENVVAAVAAADIHNIPKEKIKDALKTWNGVLRRFEYIINTPEIIYIDDYAHHPEELKAFIGSIKSIYKDKHITGIFQPHLYTRTRDFADEFAKSLDILDEIILLDIYPAREEAIEGVSSKLIFDKIKTKNKSLISKKNLLNKIDKTKTEVVLTIGAGDIGNLVKLIKNKLEQ